MSESQKGRGAEARTFEDLRAYFFRTDTGLDDETLQERAEQTRREVRARLRSREDEERRAIGRELRDCAGLELLQVADGLNDAANETSFGSAAVENLREDVQRFARRLRELSFRVYPSIIEDLGLVAAMRSACEAARAASGKDITFSANEPSTPLPGAISLCLYRVLQEALRNAIVHADTPDITVSLKEGRDEIMLSVADRGVGFDLRTAYKKVGLGLASMVEQIDELGGRIAIESGLGAGTRIVAAVPLRRRN